LGTVWFVAGDIVNDEVGDGDVGNDGLLLLILDDNDGLAVGESVLVLGIVVLGVGFEGTGA